MTPAETAVVPEASQFRVGSSPRMVLMLLMCWLVGVILVVATLWEVKEQEALEELSIEAETAASQLTAMLGEFDNIVDAVASLRSVRLALAEPSPDGVASLNRFLRKTSASLGSDKIYVVNRDGIIVGASNYASKDSFVGQDVSFRPYFQQALLGEKASYYAVGFITDGRGYFYSAPVMDGDQVVGVAVVQIVLDPLIEGMKDLQHEFLLIGYDLVVFAASRSDWSLRTLGSVPESQRIAIRKSRRYGDSSLVPLTTSDSGNEFSDSYININTGGIVQRYLVGRTLIRDAGWHVFAVMPRVQLFKRTLAYCLYFTLVYVLLVVLWLYWRKRLEMQAHVSGMNTELARRVRELTSELTSSNAELQSLVEHYQQTQQELEATQDQLVQTAKLAVLGELSAGINHELNQPLLALQTYAENSQKLLKLGRLDMVADNLAEILQITGSMHSIVSRLKVFARKSPPESRLVDIREIISASVGIMGPLLKKSGVVLGVDDGDRQREVWCEPVQVQQVLINLITNAAEALEGCPEARVQVSVKDEPDRVRVLVADNGPGIAEELQNRIFEPFFTTKQKGLGIGLALSRRIIETLSGSLVSESGANGGTVFVMTLRKQKEVTE